MISRYILYVNKHSGRHNGGNTNREYLDNVVSCRTNRIDVLLWQNPRQWRAVRLQNPLLNRFKLTVIRNDDTLLVVRRRQMHVDLDQTTAEQSFTSESTHVVWSTFHSSKVALVIKIIMCEYTMFIILYRVVVLPPYAEEYSQQNEYSPH